jgi:hypothetical protein
MSIRDKLYDLRREREAVHAKLHVAQQDLKRIGALPASSARDAEVKRKKDEVERLEQEFGYLDGLISVMTSPGAAGV